METGCRLKDISIPRAGQASAIDSYKMVVQQMVEAQQPNAAPVKRARVSGISNPFELV